MFLLGHLESYSRVDSGGWNQQPEWLVIVWVPQGCCKQGPQTRWLKTTEIYSLTVPEVGSPESSRWQDWSLLKDLSENPLTVPLLASGDVGPFLAHTGLQLHHSNLYIAIVFIWPFPLSSGPLFLLQGHGSLDLGVTWIIQEEPI